MVVIILERVPTPLRGELTRWLLEPHTGVFVGHCSAMVREKLWWKCVQSANIGGVIQIWSTNTEQRFTMRKSGDTDRRIVDFDGLQLIRIPHAVTPANTRDEKSEKLRRKRRGGGGLVIKLPS
jgi:CRISPR-associated protein Cas2